MATYIDGFKVRRAKHLAYRVADPVIDIDGVGKPVPSNYAAVVRVKDCPITEDLTTGKRTYSARNVPCIPIVYHGTYYGRGPWRKSEHPAYEQCTLYFVLDGQVWTANHRRTRKGNEL